MSKPTIVIVSGGMDSVTLLHHLHAAKEGPVIGLSVNYGQRHGKELNFAREQCHALGIEHVMANVGSWAREIPTSALTGERAVPEGHYAADSMKATIVPNRNMLMLSFAVSLAISRGAKAVAYGAHAGDRAIYPDCRHEFYDAMGEAIAECDDNPPELIAPFVSWTKGDIVKRGLELRVNYARTWTCYQGGMMACGKCGTCVERLEAFAENSIEDPMQYEDREYWQQAVAKRATTRPATTVETNFK